jgi:hypothetical protein
MQARTCARLRNASLRCPAGCLRARRAWAGCPLRVPAVEPFPRQSDARPPRAPASGLEGFDRRPDHPAARAGGVRRRVRLDNGPRTCPGRGRRCDCGLRWQERSVRRGNRRVRSRVCGSQRERSSRAPRRHRAGACLCGRGRLGSSTPSAEKRAADRYSHRRGPGFLRRSFSCDASDPRASVPRNLHPRRRLAHGQDRERQRCRQGEAAGSMRVVRTASRPRTVPLHDFRMRRRR